MPEFPYNMQLNILKYQDHGLSSYHGKQNDL